MTSALDRRPFDRVEARGGPEKRPPRWRICTTCGIAWAAVSRLAISFERAAALEPSYDVARCPGCQPRNAGR